MNVSTPRLLPGPSSSPNYDARAEAQEGEHRLREEVRRWREKAEIAEDLLKVERARSNQLEQIILNLQDKLSPLYRGLQMVFGEMESAEVISESTPSYQTATNSNFWDTQKRRFPGKPSEIIDALLERPMNTSNLVATCRMDPRTVTKNIYILNKAGLVEKNGGIFSLRQPS